MLINSFVQYINKADTKNKTILEFGAGLSTELFSKNFKKVISYDNNKEYQDKLPKYKNVEYKLLTLKDKVYKEEMKKVDYIFIDNDPQFITRLSLIKMAHKYSNDQCKLILDNGLWNVESQRYLQDNYFCKDYYGLRDDDMYTNTLVGEMKIPSYYIKTWR